MKISRSRLRRIIREERSRLIQEQSSTEMDAADIQLSIAIELFGPETLVDEEMGEIILMSVMTSWLKTCMISGSLIGLKVRWKRMVEFIRGFMSNESF